MLKMMNMVSFYISFRLLHKRIWSALIVVVQIMLSLISLTSLAVFIFDYQGNIRAMGELPKEDTSILTVFQYYDINVVKKKFQDNTSMHIGEIYYKDEVACAGKKCRLVMYDDVIIENYLPAISDGKWLTEDFTRKDDEVSAIVSADMGLNVGDTFEITLSENLTITISVQGVLKKPTQYLLPEAYADPKYFEADMIISNNSAIIISAQDFSRILPDYNRLGFEKTRSCLVFFAGQENINDEINRYGKLTPVSDAISLYKKNTEDMILGQSMIFFVFLLLAITGTLSSNVIQIRKNKRTYAIYYLLGMDWKQAKVIEFMQSFIVIVITMALYFVLEKIGMVSLQWLNQEQIIVFYIIVFSYICILFALISTLCLRKEAQEDISLSLKNLQKGE